MPRRPRIVLPGVPLHLIQRANNRQECFYAEDDYRSYLEWDRPRIIAAMDDIFGAY
jgi:putative transposase